MARLSPNCPIISFDSRKLKFILYKTTVVIRLIGIYGDLRTGKCSRPQEILSTCLYHVTKFLERFYVDKIIFITTDSGWHKFFSKNPIKIENFSLFSKKALGNKVRWEFRGQSSANKCFYESTSKSCADLYKAFLSNDVEDKLKQAIKDSLEFFSWFDGKYSLHDLRPCRNRFCIIGKKRIFKSEEEILDEYFEDSKIIQSGLGINAMGILYSIVYDIICRILCKKEKLLSEWGHYIFPILTEFKLIESEIYVKWRRAYYGSQVQSTAISLVDIIQEIRSTEKDVNEYLISYRTPGIAKYWRSFISDEQLKKLMKIIEG